MAKTVLAIGSEMHGEKTKTLTTDVARGDSDKMCLIDVEVGIEIGMEVGGWGWG